MKATTKLHGLGQSLWLDNITRATLDSGQLQRYIDEFSVTGLTSNPTIFDTAIGSGAYDEEIRRKAAATENRERLFFELAIEDLRRAADMFAPIHHRTAGVDGWVSLELSPRLAYDTEQSVRAAVDLHARAERKNLFVKIPGTEQGLPAIEETIFAGVPVNVTLLFSCEQYLAAADAYMRGIERRVEAGLRPDVPSVASVFMSRWDAAVFDRVPERLRGRLALAVGPERTPHDQHDARIDAARPRRPRPRRWPDGYRRRRRRAHAVRVRGRRDRRRRLGSDPSVRRRAQVRQLVDGFAEPHRRAGGIGASVSAPLQLRAERRRERRRAARRGQG
jgi:transaldolase